MNINYVFQTHSSVSLIQSSITIFQEQYCPIQKSSFKILEQSATMLAYSAYKAIKNHSDKKHHAHDSSSAEVAHQQMQSSEPALPYVNSRDAPQRPHSSISENERQYLSESERRYLSQNQGQRLSENERRYLSVNP